MTAKEEVLESMLFKAMKRILELEEQAKSRTEDQPIRQLKKKRKYTKNDDLSECMPSLDSLLVEQ
jgi:hypothetical protein